jgi:hypothetical protein
VQVITKAKMDPVALPQPQCQLSDGGLKKGDWSMWNYGQESALMQYLELNF